MKKIYQIPTTLIVRVETQKMIAESIAFGDSVTTAAGAESRRGDFWDDEDDDYDY
jgi:hypothetical protein